MNNTPNNFNTNTDNSQIEELRDQIEKAIGIEMFKKLLKVVEENVYKLYNLRLIHWP